MNKIQIEVVDVEQGDLRELCVNERNLPSSVLTLKNGQAVWRRNNRDNHARMAFRAQDGQVFIVMPAYNSDDKTSYYLRLNKLLTELNKSNMALEALAIAEAKAARQTKWAARREEKNKVKKMANKGKK